MVKMETNSASSVERYPTHNEMDNSRAKHLLQTCGTLIIEDMPVGTQLGIDLNVYNTAQKFLGIKMIPIGLHIIHYSAVGKDGSTAPRTSFFQYFECGQLIVKKWHQFNEDVVDCDDEQQNERLLNCFMNGSIDDRLGAYQFETYSVWVGLTDYITLSLFNRLNPKCGKIKSVSELIPIDLDKFNRDYDSLKDKDGLPIMESEPNSVINFNVIPARNVYPLGSTAAEISRHNIDSTYTFEQMLANYVDKNEILGDLQFAFTAFIIGHVYDAFEYWRNLLKLFCTSDEAIAKYSDIYSNFIRVMHFQLKQTPEDLFVDIVERDNFLVNYLSIFFSNIKLSANVDDSLKRRAHRFKANLTKMFKWDFNAENDDELPNVVQL